MKCPSRSSLAVYPLALLAVLILSTETEGFAPVQHLSALKNVVNCAARSNASSSCDVGSVTTSSLYLAAGGKKRRRRKISSPEPAGADELPDFDYDEEAVVEKSKPVEKEKTIVEAKRTPPPVMKAPTNPTPLKRGSGLNAQLAEELGGNVDGLDEDLILSAMRGKTDANWQPPRSIQETLADRSLEKLMDFDKMIEQDGGGAEKVNLPTMEEVISRRKQREAADAAREGRVEDAAMLIDTEGMGKKAAKAAQRKAAALERDAALEAEKSPFDDLNIFKLLENGAWVGIGLLVLWEVYINSPFFERAAPLIPVVYDSPVPPGM